MTYDERDFKRKQTSIMGLLAVNFGCLLGIFESGNEGLFLQVAWISLALSIPALTLPAWTLLLYGPEALKLRTFELSSIVGPLLGLIPLTCIMFHLSWIAGVIFIFAALAANSLALLDDLEWSKQRDSMNCSQSDKGQN